MARRKTQTLNTLHSVEHDPAGAMNLVRSVNPCTMLVDQDHNFIYDTGTVSVSGGGKWIESEYKWSKASGVPVTVPEVPVFEDMSRWNDFFRTCHVVGLNDAAICPVLFSGSAAAFPSRRGVVFCEFPIPSLAAATKDEYTAIPLGAVRALAYAYRIFKAVEGEATVSMGASDDAEFTITVRGPNGFLSVTHPIITKQWLTNDSTAELTQRCMAMADSTLVTTGGALLGAARGATLRRFTDSAAGKTAALRNIDNGFSEGHVIIVPTGDTTHVAATDKLVFGDTVTLASNALAVIKLPVSEGGIDRTIVVNGPAYYAALDVSGSREVRIGATGDVVTFDLPNEIRLIAPNGKLENL